MIRWNYRAEQVYLAQIERRRREEESDSVRTKLDAVEEELERVRKVSMKMIVFASVFPGYINC